MTAVIDKGQAKHMSKGEGKTGASYLDEHARRAVVLALDGGDEEGVVVAVPVCSGGVLK